MKIRQIMFFVIVLMMTIFNFKRAKCKYDLFGKEEKRQVVIASIIFSLIIILPILIILPFTFFVVLKFLGYKHSLSYLLTDYIGMIIKNLHILILACICLILYFFSEIIANNTWLAYCINAKFCECFHNYTNAIESYKLALKFIQSEDSDVAHRESTLKTIYTRLVKCYMKLGMINEAKECFEESLKWISPENQERHKEEILKKYEIS